MQTEIITALIGVAGAIAVSLLSYQLGKRQVVAQNLHTRRVEVTMRAHEMIREIAAGFEAMVMLNSSNEDERRDITYKDDVLSTHMELGKYYGSNKPWLTEEAQRIIEASIEDAYGFSAAWGFRLLERFTDEPSSSRLADTYYSFNPGQPGDAAIRHATDKFQSHLDEFEKNARSVLGTQRPWWRRIFGR